MDKDRYEDFCKQCDYQGERRVLRSFFEFLAGLTLENQQSCFEAIVRKLRNQGNLDHIIQRLEKGKLNLLFFPMKVGKILLKVS